MILLKKKQIIKFKPCINLKEIIKNTVEIIVSEINTHHRVNICLGGATSLEYIYKELSTNEKWLNTNFNYVNLFISYEYVDIFKDYLHCLNTYFVQKYFVEHKYMNNSQIYAPNTTNYKTFDKTIKKKGGIDLIILALGLNGRIAFNESGTSINSRTHIANISNQERNALITYFDEKINVPSVVTTIGIKTILKAKKIVVIAYGKNRATAIEKLFQNEYSKQYPITSLIYHNDVTVLSDLEASEFI